MKMGRRPQGKYASEMDESHAAFLDSQPMVVRCDLCPTWKFEGPAGEAREEARQHREREHPQAERERVSERKREAKRIKSLREQDPAKEVDAPAKPKRERGARQTKWFRENSIAAIQAYAAEHGRPPRIEDTRGRALPGQSPAERLFGSYTAMIREAGFDPSVRGPRARTAEAVDAAPEPRPAPAPEPEPEPTPLPPVEPLPAPQEPREGRRDTVPPLARTAAAVFDAACAADRRLADVEDPVDALDAVEEVRFAMDDLVRALGAVA